MNKKRNIVITGASRGIGFATAKVLLAAGHTLHLTASKTNSFPAELNHDNVFRYHADFSIPTQMVNLAKQIQQNTDKIDVLVNNVGMYFEKPLIENTPDDLTTMMNTNFMSSSLLTQQLLPLLNNGEHAQIINISSIAVFQPGINQSIYCASKAAITAFSNSLRKELNPQDIRITIVHPSGVNTWNAADPKGLLKPNDMANLINFVINTDPKCQLEEITLSGM